MVNFGPLTKKVIGAHVDPHTINTARAVSANVTAFGTRDVATSGILTFPLPLNGLRSRTYSATLGSAPNFWFYV